jgi:hypothetical protein
MSPRNPRFELIDVVRLPFEALDFLAAAKEGLCDLLRFGAVRRSRPAFHTSTRIALGDLSHLIRLFRSALGSAQADELVSILNAVTENREQIQTAVVLWLDLIEVLVQTAERRHGGQTGQGKLKTAEVKAALKHLLASGRFLAVTVPQPLARLLLDTFVEWAIDVIVLQANRYDLWEVEPINRAWLARFWEHLKRITLAVAIRVANLFARAVEAVQRLVEPKPTLSPALSAALAAIEREGAIVNHEGLVVRVSQLLIWVGTHRTELVQATEIVFGAVEEAEALISLSGAEKKQFARDLIWAVLEEMGFTPRSGLLEALMDSVIDLFIESSVHLFRKRGAFETRSAPA